MHVVWSRVYEQQTLHARETGHTGIGRRTALCGAVPGSRREFGRTWWVTPAVHDPAHRCEACATAVEVLAQ